MKKIIFIILLLLVITPCFATTYNAPSCSSTDVQNTLNGANKGDTVVLPSCSTTWKGDVTFCKGITLKGAGKTSTVINTSSYQLMIDGCTSAGATITVRDMTLNGSKAAGGTVQVNTIGNTVILRDMAISNNVNGGRAVWWQQSRQTPGVIARVDFTVSNNAQPLLFRDWTSSPGDVAWSAASAIGTQNMPWVEGCTFNGSATDGIDADNGGSYGIRYSQGYMNIGNHGCDSVYRSAREIEAYNNDITGIPDTGWQIQLRGGTGIIYNNRSISAANFFMVTNYRSSDLAGSLCNACMSVTRASAPRCGTGTGIDGAGTNGYPCRDQIGRGQNQGSQPLYQWNNTVSGVAQSVKVYDYATPATTTTDIQANRDYYNCSSQADCTSKGMSYKPLACPHPLLTDLSGCDSTKYGVSGYNTGGATQLIDPPTNLRIQ